MALNQEQRNHAIKMVEEAIEIKKKAFKQPYPDPKVYAASYFSKRRKFSVAELLGTSPDCHMSRRNSSYYTDSLKCDLFCLDGLGAAYKQCCEAIDAVYSTSTAELDAMQRDIKSQIMFGNDYAVIAAALAMIEEYK